MGITEAGVKHARSYLKSIFDEAIEQEFLVKDPTRKVKIPKRSADGGLGVPDADERRGGKDLR